MGENSTKAKNLLNCLKVVLASLIIVTGYIISQNTASAEETYGDYTFDYTDSKTSVEITNYNGTDSNVEIPTQINGLPVRYILSGAFANNKSIVSVVIPETVTGIGNSWNAGAFSSCTRLEQVIIKPGSDSAFIGNETFYNCPSLTNIVIPGNYVTIYDSVFKECTKLNEVKWEKSSSDFANQVLNSSAFAGCKALINVSLPENLKSIGSYAFQNCILLSSIMIPEGTEVIDIGAFQGCSSLTTASIPSTIKEIGNSWNTGAFTDCNRLSSVTLAKGIEDAYIGNKTFYNCSSLINIDIPGNYLTIYDSAFYNCNKKAKIYTISQTAIGLAKAAGLKTSSPASSYINGKYLFGSAMISGSANTGSKLAASTLAIAPINASVSYKWNIDGKVFSTKNTFTVRKNDKGKKITLTIIGKGGFKGSFTTTVTGAK